MIKFNIFLIVVSLLLGITILLQQRGGGMSSSFGSNMEVYHTKRGLEKGIFIASIVLSVLFVGGALFRVIFH